MSKTLVLKQGEEITLHASFKDPEAWTPHTKLKAQDEVDSLTHTLYEASELEAKAHDMRSRARQELAALPHEHEPQFSGWSVRCALCGKAGDLMPSTARNAARADAGT